MAQARAIKGLENSNFNPNAMSFWGRRRHVDTKGTRSCL